MPTTILRRVAGDSTVMRTELDAAAVRTWIADAAAQMAERAAEIDALNVFPVADSDTGSNLALTLAAAAQAATDRPTAAEVWRDLAVAAVLEARGNSGVIVAQLLRSFADATKGAATWDAAALRTGLGEAVTEMYRAVADPVEGTILSVARAAAEAAAATSGDLAQTIIAAVRAADEALRLTPEQLPALARSGVVDAGGLGLVVLLDTLALAVTGARVELPDRPARPRSDETLAAVRETGSDRYGYEVQYLLEAEESCAVPLRARLSDLGDSVIVVGAGNGSFNVHVHTDDVGAAIEAGVESGRPYRITVIRFDDEPAAAPARTGGPYALVAVSPGVGTRSLFEAEGVKVVVPREGRGITADDIVSVVHSTDASAVVLLHEAAFTATITEAVARARAEGIRLAVIPTRSPMQALAAVAVHDPERDLDDDVVAMAEAAAATRYAEVTVAKQAALTSVGRCEPGDVLGLIDGDVVHIGSEVTPVALDLADRALSVGAELLTVIIGEDAPEGIGDLLEAHIRERSALTEVVVYGGEQTGRPLVLGIE